MRLNLLRRLLRLVFVGSACLALPEVLGPSCALRGATPPGGPTVIVVTGAAGEAGFGEEFARWAARWEEAAGRGGAAVRRVGAEEEGGTSDRERLRSLLEAEPKASPAELWVVLIGHGTFDGREARFNLRGPDLAPSDLKGWLGSFTRPVAIVCTSSASAPFLSVLSGTNRVVITATRSGSEQNYSRFGGFLAETIADPAADLDHDGETSLLEAFLLASRRLSDFYEAEGRLATEHPLMDDNSDGQGTPPDWFRGVRVTRKTAGGAAPDGRRAHQWALVRGSAEAQLSAEQRSQRDALELALARLRDRKEKVPEADYYHELEQLLRQLAQIYQPVPGAAAPGVPGKTPGG